jgi:hypothetical protein
MSRHRVPRSKGVTLGTEALARLGQSLGGFQLTLRSSQFDGSRLILSRSRRMVWALPE